MVVRDKDIPNKQQSLGQYMTPEDTVEFCMSRISVAESYIVEPAAGQGAFLDAIRAKNKHARIKALELDPEMSSEYSGPEVILDMNFYDYQEKFQGPVHFIGNPPYRTPAYSLKTHEKYIKALRKKHDLPGVREEAALFIAQTVDLMIRSEVGGQISYILPKAIFKNNSKSFTKFVAFLRKHLVLMQVWDLDDVFEGVNRDLMWVNWQTRWDHCDEDKYFFHNDALESIDDFYGVNSDMIPHQRIFKKTYLGSVPCEGIFMSCRDESMMDFRERLCDLFYPDTVVTKDNLIELLSYNGVPHLRALKQKSEKKIAVMQKYIAEVNYWMSFVGGWTKFCDMDCYKPFRHRDEDRWYFRADWLKKVSFVYQINPNPCPSFYFPGNPSGTSKDYFGFCPYDINRNSGPGANRTVPVEGIEDNLVDEFKVLWDQTGLGYEKVFDYILWVSKSQWYKDTKSKYSRFYFGVPARVPKEFLDAQNKEADLSGRNDEC